MCRSSPDRSPSFELIPDLDACTRPLGRLVAIDGRREIRVGEAPVILGRHPSCDVLIDSDRVSRFHCSIHGCRGAIVVRDFRSMNGTWINGQRLDTGRLRLGDELAVGSVRFRREE